jgi:hypothetical protein
MSIEKLSQEWLIAKASEKAATQKRRAIEDDLAKAMRIQEDEEGTVTHKEGIIIIKAVCRMNRKIDDERLLEIAAEHGLADHLATLFRWKPELSMTAWKAADHTITDPLLDAITTTPGRPSFTITIKE